MKSPEHIILSRTDGIGDVILTVPMAHALKECFPGVKITFLGKGYTRPIIEAYNHVDRFEDWDMAGESEASRIAFLKSCAADSIVHVFPRKEIVDAAYHARIPLRIATGRRLHTYLKVNYRLWFSRKNADLHEAQLNLKMLEAFNCYPSLSLQDIASRFEFSCGAKAPDGFTQWSDEGFRVLIHPKSHGSAVDYPVESYAQIIRALTDNGIAVGITGTAKEREVIGNGLPWDEVTDFTGKLSLKELMELINFSQVIIAASTGPLHIAAALGKRVIGLYSPKRPIHAGRWQPIGRHATFKVAEKHPGNGHLEIDPNEIIADVKRWKKEML